MSILEELRRQAEAAKAMQASESRSVKQLEEETEKAMQEVSRYFNDLTTQLNVLKPVTDQVFLVDATVRFSNLRMDEFSVSARRKGIREGAPWDFIKLSFKYINEAPIVLSKEFEQIESFEKLLGANNVVFSITNERERLANRALPAEYQITQQVSAEVLVTCDALKAEITFTIRNVDRYGVFSLRFTAKELSREILDELTKSLLGQSNAFKSKGKLIPVSR